MVICTHLASTGSLRSSVTKLLTVMVAIMYPARCQTFCFKLSPIKRKLVLGHSFVLISLFFVWLTDGGDDVNHYVGFHSAVSSMPSCRSGGIEFEYQHCHMILMRVDHEVKLFSSFSELLKAVVSYLLAQSICYRIGRSKPAQKQYRKI